MREILFRAKLLFNGKWVYGGFVREFDGSPQIISDEDGGMYEVIPETVGQYTGMTDKNGKKIFEGDIVNNRVRLISGYETRLLQVVYDSTAARFVFKDEYGDFKNTPKVCEVIGNIYDNPELIGGKANG